MSKDVDYFTRLAESAKKQRLDGDGSLHSQHAAATEASFQVALQIAKHKKPDTISEELIMPCLKIVIGLILGPDSVDKVSKIPLSNSIVKRRIVDMSADIEEQVVNEINEAGLYLACSWMRARMLHPVHNSWCSYDMPTNLIQRRNYCFVRI